MHNLAGKRIVVTGGAGFIGSHLVDALILDGANVTVLDDLSTGSRSNLNPAATFHHTSLLDAGAVGESLRSVDLIFHLAADATTRESSMGWETPLHTLETNIMGTLNLYESIVKLGLKAKVVFASTAAVYGEPISTPVSETHPLNPVSPYGVSKVAGENLALAYFRVFNVQSVIVRIFNTYGPRQPRYVIFELMKKLQKDRTRLQVLGSANTVRDYCYVSDMVNALVLAARQGIGGEIYNVSGEAPVSIGQLVTLIIEQFRLENKVDVEYTGRSWKGDIQRMLGDISKIKRLGFQPKTPLREGLRKMLDSAWWQSTSRDSID